MDVHADLFQRAQAGEREAIEAIVRRYEPDILAMVRTRMGPALRARASSRDLLQECLIGLAAALPRASLRDEGSLRRYAAVIVERRAVDLLRKRQPGALEELASAGGTLPVPDAGPGPATRGAQADQQAALRAALARLPGDERLVIELRDLQGLPFESIATTLGRPSVKAVRLLHWRAMRRLSGLLDPDE